MPAPDRFPASRVKAVRIGALRCARCEREGPWIFVVDAAAPRLDAYCSPHCAAAAWVRPWAGADVETRARWP